MPKKLLRPMRIFLCHASSDKPKVRELYKRLSADGFDVWLDEVKLLPGDDWREKIPTAVESANIVLVCLSNQSINKEGYVQREIGFALDSAEEKPEGTVFIIPAKLEECEVPRRLRRWQWVNLFTEDGYERLNISLAGRAKNLGVAYSARRPEISDSPLHFDNLPTSKTGPADPFQEKGSKRSSLIGYKLLHSNSARWGGLAIIMVIALLMIGINQLSQTNDNNTPASETASSDPSIHETTFPSTRSAALTPVDTPKNLTPQTPFSIDTQAQTTHDVVRITLRDGTSKMIASNWMVYSSGGSKYWDLLTEFEFQNRESIPFSEIKSMDLGEKLANDFPVTIELLSGEIIADKLDNSYSFGAIIGIMNDGEFKATFSEIQRIDFKQTTDIAVTIHMATIVNTAGEEIKTPSDLLEAAFTGDSIVGSYTYTSDGWTLKSGLVVPFKLMKGFEFDKTVSSSGPVMVYTLLDGRTLTNEISTIDSPTVRGITEFGTFHLKRADITRIDFHRNNTSALPQLSSLLAVLTLQNGTEYKIPAYWLAINPSRWKSSFSLVGYSDIFLNEVKSLKVQPGDDISTVIASVNLFSNQTITGKMRMSGDAKLTGVDIQGNFVEVSLKDLKQVDFEQGFTPPTGISMAKVIASDGMQIEMPVHSVKLLIGGSSWGFYSYSYNEEIALTTGIKIPFSNIRKFDVGKYDTTVSGYPATIYLMDGQIINSYFANSLNDTFAISGFTDSGPFQMDMNKIQTVDFNR